MPARRIGRTALASRRPARGRAPARSRSGRCSTFAWRSPSASPTCAICRAMPASTPAAACCASAPARRTRRSRMARCRADRRDHGRRRAPHRLSRGAQPRHDRRQPGACRPGGRLGRRAAGVPGAIGDRARPAGRTAHPAGRLRHGHLRDRVAPATSCCAPSRSRCCRPRRAGATGSSAARPGEFSQGHRLRPGAARRARRAPCWRRWMPRRW